jgi:peptidoglycan DL-endopeptidase CwlO
LSGTGKRQALAFTIGLAALVTASGSATAEPTLSSKRAQEQSVLAQIDRIDASLERAVEAYNLATVKLQRIEADQRENRRELRVARSSLKTAQSMLSQRVVTIYMSEQASTLEVLLGARNLDDLINRVETVNRVSDQDTQVIRNVQRARAQITREKAQLAAAHTEQTRVVGQRRAQKASIEEQLSERQRLLSSIRTEIARIQAAELARQRQLQAQAQARLRAQQTPTVSGGVSNDPSSGAAGDPSDPSDPSVPAPPQTHGGVVGIAMQYLGVPYRWGGSSPAGFDCSGLVVYVFAQMGVSLPHSSYALWGVGMPVSRDQLQPGDLVFFNGLGHVGIYIGGGQFIHAPHTGDVVKISSMTGWYASTYVGARRV